MTIPPHETTQQYLKKFTDLTDLCKKVAQWERQYAGVNCVVDSIKQQKIDEKNAVLNSLINANAVCETSTQKNVYGLATREGYWSNSELMKVPGLQVYMMHKVFNYNAIMVCAEHPERTYPYLEQMPGLTLETFGNAEGSESKYVENAINYIDKNYHKMDIVMLYGPYAAAYPVLEHYRKKRPNGKVYITLDMSTVWLKNMEDEAGSFPYPPLTRFLDNCDVISTSCYRMSAILNKRWLGHIIENIPNGFYRQSGDFDGHKKARLNLNFEQKKNIILTVGRIGTKQKDNGCLLVAFAEVAEEIKNWNLKLVGEIDGNFQKFIKDYFNKFPHLKSRVIFTGNITDKELLYNEYKQAKIFTLTSDWEGGNPNVVSEALYHGCFPIVSDFDASGDITKNGELGRVFPLRDYLALSKILLEVCKDNFPFEDYFSKIIDYAENYYNWETNIKKIHALLFGLS